jgi:hypothetical protein
MASKKDKGPWSGERKPYHSEGRVVEAAKWLRIASNRFLQGKDSSAQVTAAVSEWLWATDQDARIPAIDREGPDIRDGGPE